MEKSKTHHPEKDTTQKKGKAPVQPEKPVGEVTSSGDNVRRPTLDTDTPPEEQTKGNP